MALLPFAQRHLLTELPALDSLVAAKVDPASFLLAKRYLGSSVVFLNRNGEPAVTYKLVAHKSLNIFLENAVRCAHKAQRHGFSTPTVCTGGRFRGRAFAIYSWLPGTPLVDLKAEVSQDKRLLTLAVESITELHTRTLEKGGPDRALLQQRMDWWRELLATHPDMPASLLSTIDSILSLLLAWLPRFPAVLMHGDCAGVNLLRDGQGKFHFIDWELGLTEGLPAIDLVTLLLSQHAFGPNHGALGPTFAHCFLDPGPLADECRQIVRDYAQRLEVPPEALPVLAATTHIKMVAENRHCAVLHHGPWSSGRTIEDLEVLNTVFERWISRASKSSSASCATSDSTAPPPVSASWPS